MDSPFDLEKEERELFHRKPLKDEIFEILHRRIIAGKYAPGEWIRQEDISSQLGVSQTPVREALDLLVSTGLAERLPYRGVRVLQLTAEEIADAYALRFLLECAAASAAASHHTPDQVKTLQELLEQSLPLVTLNQMSLHRQLNREFHLCIALASGNALLARVYRLALNSFPDWMLYEYMFRHPALLAASLAQEYQEHWSILQAIKASDPSAAAVQARQHMTNLGDELVAYLGIPAGNLRQKLQALAV